MLLLTSRQNIAPQPKGCCLRCLEIEDTPLWASVLPEWHPALPHPILTTIRSNYSGAALTDDLRRTEGSFGSQQSQAWGNFSVGEGLRFETTDLSRAGVHTFASCGPDEHPKQPANVENLLGSSGEVFAGILSQKKKRKAFQLCWQNPLGLPGCVISSLEPVQCQELHHPSEVYWYKNSSTAILASSF